MASDNPNAGDSSRRSRVPPTLDLRAEEVRDASNSGTDAAPAAASESAPAERAPQEPAAEAPARSDAPEPARETPAEAAVDADPVTETTAAPDPAATPVDPVSEAPRAEGTKGRTGTLVAALVIGAVAGGAAGGGLLYYASRHAPAPVDLSPLAARVSALESRPAVDPSALAAVRQGIAGADARFAALDADIAALKSAVPGTAPSPDLDDLKAALSRTEAAVAEVSAQVTALKGSQEALKSTHDALQSAVASAATAAQQAQGQAQVMAPRLDSLGAHIEAVRKEASDAAGAAAAINRGAAAVLVLGTLKQSLDAGRPFASELVAARALLGPRAAPLEPFADKAQAGFPPLSELADQLSAEGGAAIDGLSPTSEAPAPDASLVTRFLASAQGLVKVRPADGLDPDSLRGILARAVTAVRAGDMETALAALKQLPPPVQEKLAAVTARIEARSRAAEVAATLYQQALAAISGNVP